MFNEIRNTQTRKQDVTTHLFRLYNKVNFRVSNNMCKSVINIKNIEAR